MPTYSYEFKLTLRAHSPDSIFSIILSGLRFVFLGASSLHEFTILGLALI